MGPQALVPRDGGDGVGVAGERGRRYDWGYGCGVCPACRLRAAGYAAYREARKNGERGRTEV